STCTLAWFVTVYAISRSYTPGKWLACSSMIALLFPNVYVGSPTMPAGGPGRGRLTSTHSITPGWTLRPFSVKSRVTRYLWPLSDVTHSWRGFATTLAGSNTHTSFRMGSPTP